VCGVDREEEKHRDCVTDCDSRFYPNARLFCFLCTDKPTGYGSSSRRAPQTGIVDECCFRSCDLRRLEMYCAPLKPAKSARSVRAQRHTDVPKTQKVSQPGGIQPSSSHLCLLHVSEPKQKFWPIVSWLIPTNRMNSMSILSVTLYWNFSFLLLWQSDNWKMVEIRDYTWTLVSNNNWSHLLKPLAQIRHPIQASVSSVKLWYLPQQVVVKIK
jgi:hypothetical protein